MAEFADKRRTFYQRLEALKQERRSFEKHWWKDIQLYTAPFRGRFDDQNPNDGERNDHKILNSTPTFAARTAASGIMSGLTSPARRWFRMKVSDASGLDEDKEVQNWLHVVEQRMREVFAESNLYDVLPVVYMELVLFGVAAMMEVEDPDDVVRFHAYTAGEYYLANNHRQRVDVFYREFKMTAAQLVEQFGEDNVSDSTRKLWKEDKADEWVEVVHAIEPNDDRIPGKLDNQNMPYRSVYFERGARENEGFLSVSGFREFPVMAPRWSTRSNDVYGTEAPGMMALGDSKQLQKEQHDKAEGIVRNIKPPLQAPQSMKSTDIMNVPGGVSYYNSLTQNGQGIRPIYETNVPLNELIQDIQETEERIRRAFFADLFFAISNSNRPSDMKAEVAAQMDRERLLMLGPVVERLENELLDPLINRTFNILEEKGEIPPAPEQMEGVDLEVDYVSTLSQVQKAVGIGDIEQFTSLVLNWAQVDPTVVDKINLDQAADESADMLGVVPTVVRSDEEVARIRQQRQQQQAAQQAIEGSQALSETAQNLSQAPVGSRSALETLLGQQGNS
jgi:hypothetical protein